MTGLVFLLAAAASPLDGPFLRGEVFDETAGPLVGAAVTLDVRSGDEQRTLTARADAAGRWSIETGPIDSARLTVEAPGMCEWKWTVRGAGYLSGDVIRSVLQPGGVLQVRVLDAEGRPIEGAAGMVGTRYAYGTLRRSDADGLLDMRRRPYGETAVSVAADGYAPQAIPVDVTKDMSPIDVRLLPGRPLTLSLRRADGLPVSDVSVQLNTLEHSSAMRRVLADRFAAAAVDAGEWNLPAVGDGLSLVISGPEIRTVRTDRLSPRDGPHKITLQPHPTVVVTVRTADGSPTPAWTLGTAFFSSKGNASTWTAPLREGRPVEDPTFSGAVETLTDRIRVRVACPGYKTVVSPTLNVGDGSARFDAVLRPASPRSVRVRNPDGSPAAEVDAYFPTAGTVVTLFKGGQVAERDETTTGQTDGGGQLPIPDMGESTYVVLLGETGLWHGLAAAIEDGEEITLAAWSLLRIEADDRGAADLRRIYSVDYPSEAEPQWSHIERVAGPLTFQFSQRAEVEGVVRFERLPPARVRVTERMNGGDADGIRLVGREQDVDLQPGRETTLTFSPDTPSR